MPYDLSFIKLQFDFSKYSLSAWLNIWVITSKNVLTAIKATKQGIQTMLSESIGYHAIRLMRDTRINETIINGIAKTKKI